MAWSCDGGNGRTTVQKIGTGCYPYGWFGGNIREVGYNELGLELKQQKLNNICVLSCHHV